MNDLRLAKHIAYVHQNSTTPETDINPLDMKTMRRYIAQCKKKMPIIPKELTEYITENYVLLREESRYRKICFFDVSKYSYFYLIIAVLKHLYYFMLPKIFSSS